MKVASMKLLPILLAFACAWASISNVNAHDPVKSPYEVRFGTMEVKSDGLYVFRWESQEEIFDSSAVLSGKGIKFPGLPDLMEIGFRAKSGKIFEYGEQPKIAVVERFMREHPNEEGDTLIFRGRLDENLELKIKGKTPVCRVDVRFTDHDITLWKNLPVPPDVPGKASANK